MCLLILVGYQMYLIEVFNFYFYTRAAPNVSPCWFMLSTTLINRWRAPPSPQCGPTTQGTTYCMYCRTHFDLSVKKRKKYFFLIGNNLLLLKGLRKTSVPKVMVCSQDQVPTNTYRQSHIHLLISVIGLSLNFVGLDYFVLLSQSLLCFKQFINRKSSMYVYN